MYTRRGDGGETSLYGPRRVPKDSPRVEAYGTVDELNSYLGIVITECRDRLTVGSIKKIQKMLFVAGADLASDTDSRKVPRITHDDTLELERMTDELLNKLPGLKNFIIPGGSRLASRIQFARAICRRAERRAFTASKAEKLNPELLPFLNRLSSYLFNLARFINQRQKIREDIWKG